MLHNIVGDHGIGNLIDVELGGVVHSRAVQPDAVEHRLGFLHRSVEDDSPGIHQDDVGEEMEDVRGRLMNGEENDARCGRRLLEQFRFRDVSGELSQSVHHGEGAKTVQARRRLVAEENARLGQQLLGMRT